MGILAALTTVVSLVQRSTLQRQQREKAALSAQLAVARQLAPGRQDREEELAREPAASLRQTARVQQQSEEARRSLQTLQAENEALRKRLAAREDGGIGGKAIAALEAALSGRFQPRDIAALLVGTERGGPGSERPAISLVQPVATFVRDVHPTLEARPLPGATGYEASLINPDAASQPIKLVALSPTRWRVADALPRGQVYEWQVTARKNGGNVASPVARFGVLEPDKTAEMARAERAYAGRHLTLAILYAQAGLIDDAEQEIEAFRKADPQNPVAQNLLRDLRAQRSQ